MNREVRVRICERLKVKFPSERVLAYRAAKSMTRCKLMCAIRKLVRLRWPACSGSGSIGPGTGRRHQSGCALRKRGPVRSRWPPGVWLEWWINCRSDQAQTGSIVVPLDHPICQINSFVCCIFGIEQGGNFPLVAAALYGWKVADPKALS